MKTWWISLDLGYTVGGSIVVVCETEGEARTLAETALQEWAREDKGMRPRPDEMCAEEVQPGKPVLIDVGDR